MYICTHGHDSLWNTIYSSTDFATAHLLCLDWMWLELRTDSHLISCLLLTIDQILETNKISWYNWIHKFNEEHSSQQHVCKGCEKNNIYGKQGEKSPVAFDYMTTAGSRAPLMVSTRNFPQSNSFTPRRELSINTKKEEGNQNEERG